MPTAPSRRSANQLTPPSPLQSRSPAPQIAPRRVTNPPTTLPPAPIRDTLTGRIQWMTALVAILTSIGFLVTYIKTENDAAITETSTNRIFHILNDLSQQLTVLERSSKPVPPDTTSASSFVPVAEKDCATLLAYLRVYRKTQEAKIDEKKLARLQGITSISDAALCHASSGVPCETIEKTSSTHALSLLSDSTWDDGKEHEFFIKDTTGDTTVYYGPFTDHVSVVAKQASSCQE